MGVLSLLAYPLFITLTHTMNILSAEPITDNRHGDGVAEGAEYYSLRPAGVSLGGSPSRTRPCGLFRNIIHDYTFFDEMDPPKLPQRVGVHSSTRKSPRHTSWDTCRYIDREQSRNARY